MTQAYSKCNYNVMGKVDCMHAQSRCNTVEVSCNLF